MFRAASTLLIAALIAAPATAEDVYKNVDSQGVPTFSDKQTQGAEKISVEPVNVQPIPIPDYPAPLPATPTSEPDAQYRHLAISSPEDETTLRDEHDILLEVTLQPNLRRGHKIEFLDNGLALQPPGKSTQMQLLNLDRGVHKLTARILDEEGNTIKTSSPVTVYIFRTVFKPAGG